MRYGISLAIKFYKDFIENLDEDSPVFFKLLEINSKYGYYEDDKVFNFNLLNVDDIKQHLLSLIPDLIYFFNSQNTKTKAFSFSMTGEISVNEYYLFEKYKKMDLQKKYFGDEEINAKNIAMTISRYLIHENGGHTKFRNNNENDIKSPVKCVSDGKIKTMTHLKNKDNSDDLIKIFPLNKEGKGDAGHLLEMAFGKIKGEYTITYFDRIKDLWSLINYPEYFVKKEKIKILEQYIYYKYNLEKYNIQLKQDFFYKNPLEDYIKPMKEKLDNFILSRKIQEFNKSKNTTFLSKKKTSQPIEKIQRKKIQKINENEFISIDISSCDEEKALVDSNNEDDEEKKKNINVDLNLELSEGSDEKESGDDEICI